MRTAEVPLANRAHWPRIMKIEQRSFSQPWRLEDFQLLAHDERALNVGLWHGEELVGYALGYIDAETAELHLASLAIDPEFRRQGWGSYLLAETLTRAEHRGCAGCRLEVRASNAVALYLYRRLQFDVVGRRRAFYTSPVEDAVLMRRPLSASSTRSIRLAGGEKAQSKLARPTPDPGVADDG